MNKEIFNILVSKNGFMEFVNLKKPINPVKNNYLPFLIFTFIYLS